MRFDQADHHVHALIQRGFARRKHGVCLAHARAGAKENLELAARTIRLLRLFLKRDAA